MGVRFPTVVTTAIINVTLVTTALTVIATTPPLNISLDFAQVLLYWFCVLTLGTGTTSVTQAVRRGSGSGGAAINANVAIAGTAGNATQFSGCYVDTPGAVAGQQYSFTLQQNAATANGTVADVCLMAFAL